MSSSISEAMAKALASSEQLPPEDLGIPAEIIAWVEREYAEWCNNTSAWRTLTVASEKEAEDLKTAANKYLRYGRLQGRLTFQSKTGYPKKVKGGYQMAYRVRDPIQRERSGS